MQRGIERWLETSRLNPTGLLRMPHPRLPKRLSDSFDHVLEETPRGAKVRFELEVPKWWFLHHLIGRGYLLHGSNEQAIERFRTRANRDAYGNPIDAVFASDDPIWPLYFAVVRRDGLRHGYINWCVHVRGESRYLFSIGRDPHAEDAWTRGTIYILPADTFTPTAGSRELTSLVAVEPRARLAVDPEASRFETGRCNTTAAPRRRRSGGAARCAAIGRAQRLTADQGRAG